MIIPLNSCNNYKTTDRSKLQVIVIVLQSEVVSGSGLWNISFLGCLARIAPLENIASMSELQGST